METIFLKAKPIWLLGRQTEMNLRVQFKAVCPAKDDVEVHIATSGIYQLWVNGQFVSYGPARAGRNHFRMDRIPVSQYLTTERNCVVIEVNGYNADSYYIQNQASFLQAEICCEDVVIAATGYDFSARVNPYYYQNIQRYSVQRPMLESYCYMQPKDALLTDPAMVGTEPIECCEDKIIIERIAPYPLYEQMRASLHNTGCLHEVKPKQYTVLQGYNEKGEVRITGYNLSETKCPLSRRAEELQPEVTNAVQDEILTDYTFACYELEHNATGMLTMRLDCKEDTVLYVMFDEVLANGVISPLRGTTCNVVRYDLMAGEHHIQFFEVYTMKFISLNVEKGCCKVKKVGMVEYKHPPVSYPKAKDAQLQKIVDAAIETYRQCSVDLFIDCPGRERAGWLCDSYFTAQAEYVLTGKNDIERSFLENFLHEENYKNLPEGMLPMCYPADFASGTFIPNWAMFFVVELGEFYRRNKDKAFVMRFENKVKKLVAYFEKFENAYGLLENLEKWIFVEWSRANDQELVNGINYPSNMMYYMMLECAYNLFGNERYKEKATKVKAAVCKYGFDGKFFVDHADIINGEIVNRSESTEVCQYYAFFSGVATQETHKELFDVLIRKFGSHRDSKNVYPEIYPAQPFIGTYLRLHIMHKAGFQKEIEDDIRGYFLYMAETTGTLWEHARTTASCNHGFASNVLYLL